MCRRRICECFCLKKTAYFVICPSNQPLCFSPLSQVGGRALLPSLQPNRAPATAPLVSASPPCMMKNTIILKQTVVAWKTGTQVQVAWESSRHFATSALLSSRNDAWEMRTEIPYWWCVTTKIWVVLLWGKFATTIGSTTEIRVVLISQTSLRGETSGSVASNAGFLLVFRGARILSLPTNEIGAPLKMSWWEASVGVTKCQLFSPACTQAVL